MSYMAQEWAENAPVADTYERIILMVMAVRADSDGTGTWSSKATLAEAALCDQKTVQRRLDAMRKRGLIAYGDQELVAHYRADRRPVVYDLMFPFNWYSRSQWEKACQDADSKGRRPVDPDTRPDLTPPKAAGRKPRSDKGVPRLRAL